MVYSREVDGEVLTFGVSGILWRNSLVMFDRETKSLWSHITGRALSGSHRGEKLKLVTGVPRVTWKELRKSGLNIKVLSVNGIQDPGRDQYADYSRKPVAGVRPGSYKDGRLPAKEPVIGVALGETARAYPASLFESTSVIEDEMEGEPLIVFRDNRSFASGVFLSTFEGRRITLSGRADGVLVADSDGNEWNLLLGMAVSGDLKGKRLKRLPYFDGFWFAWSDFNPRTQIAGR